VEHKTYTHITGTWFTPRVCGIENQRCSHETV